MDTDVLGIPISNFSVHEAINKTRKFLESEGLNVVGYISTHKLILASENEKQKRVWRDIDLKVCEDLEVLKAMGKVSATCARDVEEMKYLKEVLKLLSKEKKEIFLLSDNEINLKEAESDLLMMEEKLVIIGKSEMSHYDNHKDGLINLINFTAPSVILSRLPYPEGIHLLHDYGRYLNASLWIMLPDRIIKDKKHNWLDKITKFIYKNLLKKKINHY